MMQRQQGDPCAQADTARALGHRHGHLQRGRHDREWSKEMKFRQPRDIKPEFVSQRDLFDRLAIAIRGGLVGSTRQLIEESEFHLTTPYARSRGILAVNRR